jgi:hypothetical protein
LRIPIEEITRSAEVVIGIRDGADRWTGIGHLWGALATITAAIAAQAASVSGIALFGGAAAGGTVVFAAVPPQASGRHRERRDREEDENRAFHVRRFLFWDLGR